MRSNTSLQVQSKTVKGCTFPEVCPIFTGIEKIVIVSDVNDQKAITQGKAVKPINLILRAYSLYMQIPFSTSSE